MEVGAGNNENAGEMCRGKNVQDESMCREMQVCRGKCRGKMCRGMKECVRWEYV